MQIAHAGCFPRRSPLSKLRGITGELAASAGLAQSTTSQHLAVLRDAGLVCGTIEGPATCYCLDLATLAWFRDRVGGLAEQLAAGCADGAC